MSVKIYTPNFLNPNQQNPTGLAIVKGVDTSGQFLIIGLVNPPNPITYIVQVYVHDITNIAKGTILLVSWNTATDQGSVLCAVTATDSDLDGPFFSFTALAPFDPSKHVFNLPVTVASAPPLIFQENAVALRTTGDRFRLTYTENSYHDLYFYGLTSPDFGVSSSVNVYLDTVLIKTIALYATVVAPYAILLVANVTPDIFHTLDLVFNPVIPLDPTTPAVPRFLFQNISFLEYPIEVGGEYPYADSSGNVGNSFNNFTGGALENVWEITSAPGYYTRSASPASIFFKVKLAANSQIYANMLGRPDGALVNITASVGATGGTSFAVGSANLYRATNGPLILPLLSNAVGQIDSAINQPGIYTIEIRSLGSFGAPNPTPLLLAGKQPTISFKSVVVGGTSALLNHTGDVAVIYRITNVAAQAQALVSAGMIVVVTPGVTGYDVVESVNATLNSLLSMYAGLLGSQANSSYYSWLAFWTYVGGGIGVSTQPIGGYPIPGSLLVNGGFGSNLPVGTVLYLDNKNNIVGCFYAIINVGTPQSPVYEDLLTGQRSTVLSQLPPWPLLSAAPAIYVPPTPGIFGATAHLNFPLGDPTQYEGVPSGGIDLGLVGTFAGGLSGAALQFTLQVRFLLNIGQGIDSETELPVDQAFGQPLSLNDLDSDALLYGYGPDAILAVAQNLVAELYGVGS